MEEKMNENVIREKVVVENTPPVVEVVKPVEKKHEGFPKIVAVVLFIIILAMAGFMVWHFLTTNHEVKECETPKDEGTQQPVVSPSEEWENDKSVREVVTVLREKAQADLTRNTGVGGTVSMAIENVYDQLALTVKPQGVNVVINLERSYGFVVPEVTDKVLYDFVMSGKLGADLAEVLVQRGFVQGQEPVMGTTLYTNPETGVICSVGAGIPFNVVCGHESWYDKENVAFLNELAEAYKEKTGVYPYYIDAEKEDIEDSEYAPYQRLEASEFGAATLFYRTSPDAKWQFFTGTQALLSCSKYDTDDLKKAYLGEPCHDEVKGTDSKVEL